MSIGNSKSENRKYSLHPDIPCMDRTSSEKDVGVVIDDKLSFEKHIIEKVNKANSILGIMSRSFEYLDQRTFKMMYVGLIRPHIEYASSVWKPYKKKDITMLENIQKATRLIPGLSTLTYEERLKKNEFTNLSM